MRHRSSRAAVEGEIDREWWKRFGDPVLDELVAAATANNRDLAAATARLREARAQRRERLFDFLPTITGKASYDNVRQSANGSPGVPAGTPIARDYELFDAGFDASWEFDLFGRVRRLNESAKASQQAAAAARNQVVLSVISEVARNYFELRGAQRQLDVARNNAATQTSALELVNSAPGCRPRHRARYLRAVAQVESTLASVPPSKPRSTAPCAASRCSPARSLASSPRSSRRVQALPALPDGLALGSPEALLRRRPDIRTAERQLASATAAVGVQVADLFPRVTVNAGIGLTAPRLSQLDDPGNDRRSFGPSLSWGCSISATSISASAPRARNAESLANYEQTVLLALEETENALSDYARERARARPPAQGRGRQPRGRRNSRLSASRVACPTFWMRSMPIARRWSRTINSPSAKLARPLRWSRCTRRSVAAGRLRRRPDCEARRAPGFGGRGRRVFYEERK